MTERFYKLFHEKNAFQRYLARRFLFNCCQRVGFHVAGNHFYELLPDTRLVAATYSDAPRDLRGIDWRFKECEREALRLIRAYGSEYTTGCRRFGFVERNHYYRGLDALMLFLVLRDLKPARMIEVGQGFSTRIALAALEHNADETGVKAELISIDPYARLLDDQMPRGVSLRLLRQEVQTVEIRPLLDDCGFLFVDSSHVYKFGSDVEYEFTRIYSNLQAQSVLHVHDIYSPYNYPLEWMIKDKRFWNEQYVLEAFLMFNKAFEIAMPLNLLVRQSSAFLAEVEALSLEQEFKFRGSSFYLRRK